MTSTSKAHRSQSQKLRYKELKAQMDELDRRDCDNYLAVCELLRQEAVAAKELYLSVGTSVLPRSTSYHSWFTESKTEAVETDEQRFATLFERIQTYVDEAIEPLGVQLFSVASQFDFADVRANGYRSLLIVVRICCSRLLSHTRHIRASHKSFSFRTSSAHRELDAFVGCLSELRWCLHYGSVLAELTASSGTLFLPDQLLETPQVQRMLFEAEMIDQTRFYGHCLGFQYVESLQRPLQFVVSGMAAYSTDFSGSSSGVLRKIASVVGYMPKYLLNTEKRGEQIVNMTRSANIEFCKSFWNIAESPMLQTIPMIVCPPVEISVTFELPAIAFMTPSPSPDEEVLVQPPLSHSGPGPVNVRLISHRARVGQEWLGVQSRNLSELSPYLLVHCHGGGFVAQSSRSHEVYLRHWAQQLDCPILSIDYSLAPESPFPRALEEAFFAYCWALRNCDKLGSSAKRVLVAGDSAGGNLVTALTLRALEYGVRVPDGIFAAYTPVLVRPLPSPSRILSLMDPLLPIGILLRCLLAYAGIDEKSLPQRSPPPPFRAGLPSTNSPDEETVLFSADVPETGLNTPDSPVSLGSVDDSAFEDAQPWLSNSPISDTVNGIRRSTTWSHFGGQPWTHELARRHFEQKSIHPSDNPLFKMQHAPIPYDPYMSPYLADDDLLRRLPPVTLLACHLDPVLDDCVMFAKRLGALDCRVQLRVMEELPHGFLNFTLASKDAKRGCDECIRLMKEMFEASE